MHVAGAVTDTDETYGAYDTVENKNLNCTDNSKSNINSYSTSNVKIMVIVLVIYSVLYLE